jgi:hypothetical protein
MRIAETRHERSQQSREFGLRHPVLGDARQQFLEPQMKRDLAAAVEVWIGMIVLDDRQQLPCIRDEFVASEHRRVDLRRRGQADRADQERHEEARGHCPTCDPADPFWDSTCMHIENPPTVRRHCVVVY